MAVISALWCVVGLNPVCNTLEGFNSLPKLIVGNLQAVGHAPEIGRLFLDNRSPTGKRRALEDRRDGRKVGD